MPTYIALTNIPIQLQDLTTSVNLSGGSLEFYLAGTSTPTNLYSNDTGTSIGTSITLNSGGLPESGSNVVTLYYDADIAVDIATKNSSGLEVAPRISVKSPALSLTAQQIGGILYPVLAREGSTVVNAEIAYGHVLRYGDNTVPGTTDMTVAIQAALDQQLNGGPGVELGNGIFAHTDLTYYSGSSVSGINPTESQLKYTGSGVALASSSPGTRIYDGIMENFHLLDAGTGTIGIDINSLSTSQFSNLLIDGFDTAVEISSPVSGNAVYNRFFNVTAANSTIGWDIQPISSNATSILSSRCNSCTTGIKIADSNHVMLHDINFDEGTTGVDISASISGISPSNHVTNCRFEGYTTNINIGADVTDTQISNNTHIDGIALADAGTRTQVWETQAAFANVRLVNSTAASTGPAMRLERTEAAADSPVLELVDSNAGSGAPSSLRIATERNAGNSIEVERGGTTYFSVTPAGAPGFYGVTPPAQASHITNPTDLATSITAINAILVILENLGVKATS